MFFQHKRESVLDNSTILCYGHQFYLFPALPMIISFCCYGDGASVISHCAQTIFQVSCEAHRVIRNDHVLLKNAIKNGCLSLPVDSHGLHVMAAN